MHLIQNLIDNQESNPKIENKKNREVDSTDVISSFAIYVV
jgi:hypothetical protein